MSYLLPPCPKIRQTILKSVNTNEDRLKQDVAHLKTWLQKTSHLPQNLDDDLLESFVIGCNNLEESKTRIDRYFTIRNFAKEFYADRDPLKLELNSPDPMLQFFLPGFAEDGSIVYMFRIPEGVDPQHCQNAQFNKRQLLLFDYILHKGILNKEMIILYDFAGMSLSLMQQFNLTNLFKTGKCFEDNYPIHLKKLILHNCKPFLVTIYDNLIKPTIKKKLASRVAITKSGDDDALKEFIPEEMLPSDMGGSGLSSLELHESYVRLLEEEREWCVSTEKQKSDESKRLIKTKFDFEQHFGIEGNFRALSVD